MPPVALSGTTTVAVNCSVEIARDPNQDSSARADEISRWLLAEGTPLALPDSRWDRMAYGIRDSEEFLKAIT